MKTFDLARFFLIVSPLSMAVAAPGCTSRICPEIEVQPSSMANSADPEALGDCEDEDEDPDPSEQEAGGGGIPKSRAQGVAGSPIEKCPCKPAEPREFE